MSSLSLSDIKAFHADLLSIRSAGVPLRWGSGKTKPVGSGRRRGADLPVAELGTALSAIEMRLAAASLDGRKLTETLEHDIELPPQYLPTLRTWHRERRSPNAFEGWARGSLGGVRRDWGLRISLVQPLVWLAVGYLGLIFIVFAVAPLFLALHEQLSIPPGFALTVLLGVRAAFSVWGWLIPIVIAVVAYICFWGGWDQRAALPESNPPTLTSPSLKFVVERPSGRTGTVWVLAGGVLVLALALSVFGPLIELLYAVGLPVNPSSVRS